MVGIGCKNVTTNLGKSYLEIMETKENKLVEFISNHEPVTYSDILKNAHVRRKNLRIRLNKLEQEKKIMKTSVGTYIIFNETNLSKFNYLYKLHELAEYQKQAMEKLQKIWKKMEVVGASQPVRFYLAKTKSKLNELGIHKHEFIAHQTIPHFSMCRCDSISFIDGKTHHRIPQNEIEEFLIDLKKLDIQLKDDSNIIKEFITNFKLYPRLENTKFQGEDGPTFLKNQVCINDEDSGADRFYKMMCWYESKPGIIHNPLGIYPNFRRRDGSIDYDKIEEVYKNRKFFRTWPFKCPRCGKVEQIDVADEFNQIVSKTKILNDSTKYFENGMLHRKLSNKIKHFRNWPFKCTQCGLIEEKDIIAEMDEMIIKAKRGEEIELIA